MDSIKYQVKGHSVEFSKRALTIDNKVYSYTGISQIKHSSAYHAYLFKYNGEWVKLFYNEPDGKTIAILFKRIQKMNERRAAYARATQSIDTSAIAAALAASSGEKPAAPEAKAEEPAAKAEEPEVEKPAEEAPVVEEAQAVEEAPVEEAPAEEAPAVEPEKEVPEAEEAPAEEAQAEEEVPAEETQAEEKPAEEAPAEEPAKDAETVAAAAAEAEIKKAKRKKAFLIFGIIIALFLIAGIIYFLTVGTTDDSSQGPNVDETHQYNDIDELIEEMQE